MIKCFNDILYYSINDYNFIHELYERLRINENKKQFKTL